ncbi:MAG: SDR family NAD(P)-dependent oxidoreductase, partial [Xanthobacteraceae bacterium]
MADRLKGKVALVTAAGQGIGRAIAEAFVAEGATVIATDVDEAKLAAVEATICTKLDVRSADGVAALAKRVEEEFTALNVLANVAGYVHQGTIFDCSDADWDFSFDLNVKSMHRTIQAFLPGMLERGSASIVNISSGASTIKAAPTR